MQYIRNKIGDIFHNQLMNIRKKYCLCFELQVKDNCLPAIAVVKFPLLGEGCYLGSTLEHVKILHVM